ncbi:MAG TPA: hypothetical protein VG223_06450 [Solirubrobacteraceae bacterium]|jgi:hypothetical protein|nr:hypothetical protein [Solirubrobacteraceae bacterium]
MRRRVILVVTLLFIAMLATLTVDDVATYGVTPLDVVAVMILALFAVAIVGALRERPPDDR